MLKNKKFLIFLKSILLFIIGGSIYIGIELAWRGHSHWTMFILGGACFYFIGLINELLSWETPLWLQAVIGSLVVTILEFCTGIVVNIIMKWNVWDYSNMPLNILGQICFPFSLAWCALSIVGILLDDWIRWKLFKEEKPHYHLF